MSASNEWTVYHLTPSGWKEGSSKIDGGGGAIIHPPSDRVKTCKYSEFLGALGGHFERNVEEVWTNGDSTTIARLEAQFGPCPEVI